MASKSDQIKWFIRQNHHMTATVKYSRHSKCFVVYGKLQPNPNGKGFTETIIGSYATVSEAQAQLTDDIAAYRAKWETVEDSPTDDSDRETLTVNSQSARFDILRTAAQLEYGNHVGGWLYNTWQAHNQHYFEGMLQVIPIHFGLTPHGGSLGRFEHTEEYRRITIHKSLLDPSDDAWQILSLLGERFASDVLLHEMIHQAIDELGNRSDEDLNYSSHNCSAWVWEVNRIAPMLGLEVKAAVARRRRISGKIKQITPDNSMSLDELSRFPHSVTQEAFYRGETGKREA